MVMFNSYVKLPEVSQIQLNMSFPPKLAALLLHIYFFKKKLQ